MSPKILLKRCTYSVVKKSAQVGHQTGLKNGKRAYEERTIDCWFVISRVEGYARDAATTEL